MKHFYKVLFICLLMLLGSFNHSNAASTAVSNYSNTEIANNDDITDSKFILYIAEGILNIKYNKPLELTNGEVIVYNLLGQEITRKKLEVNSVNQVPLSIQNTCYIVKISYSGKVHTQKVVPSL